MKHWLPLVHSGNLSEWVELPLNNIIDDLLYMSTGNHLGYQEHRECLTHVVTIQPEL